MFLIYLALPQVGRNLTQQYAWLPSGLNQALILEATVAGTLALGLNYGAYMTEPFRGAILAIPKGQMEAAWAFGMGPLRTFIRITLPQMVRYALPSFTNNWLVLIKSTAIVSIIGLSDLMTRGQQAAGNTREPFSFYLAVALIYLVFTSVSELVFGWANRRLAIGVRKGEL